MTTSVSYTRIDSPVGRLLLAADADGLRVISFLDGRKDKAIDPDPAWREVAPDESATLRETVRQLRAYWARELRDFDLPLHPEGTPFQLTVWKQLCAIPYGTTISYGELARRVGNPKGSRAVGLANGSNPIAIVIPCHRVIGSNGKLTGYGGGLPIKEKLLELEQQRLTLL
jgi:methylated-DNA-[protein]-cysteine S-methyltransferase